MLGVSFDSVQENGAFADKFAFPYRLLSDTARTIGMAYGACGSERDAYARRISYIIGPDGRIRHAFPNVDPKTHPAEVLGLL